MGVWTVVVAMKEILNYIYTEKPNGVANALGIGLEKNRVVKVNSIIFGARNQKDVMAFN